jgi:hypothetical protein
MKQIILFIFILLQTCTILAQCNMDQHSTTWYDSWSSCVPKASPNVIRGNGHWIMYHLGHTYALSQSHWWNGNEPSNLQNGIKRMSIDISQDGVNWTEVLTMELPIASGKNTYEGFDGPSLEKVTAKYILLTALENHGGPCYSFGEMKINVELISTTTDEISDNCIEVKAYPNPFQNITSISVNSNCNNDLSNLIIEDIYGRKVLEKTIQNNNNEIEFNGSKLASGIYFVKIGNGRSMIQKKLIKVE